MSTRSLFSRLAYCSIAIATAACLLSAAAISAAAPARVLRFENLIDRYPGAPFGMVTTIVQDKLGFIWIGAQYGVYRHDGLSSIIYQHDSSNPHSLPGDYVRAIFRDKQDRLWFGTNNGLALYDPESDGFTTFRSEAAAQVLASNEIIGNIIGDGGAGLWLGTSLGLQHFDPATGHFEVFRHDPSRADSLASDRVEGLALDAQGGLWVSVWAAGIDYLAPGSKSFRHYRLDDSAHPGTKFDSVNALRMDSRQQLWIGTATGMLVWRPGTDWSTRKSLPAPAGYDEFWVLGIYEDPHGTIWVGTQPAGLLQWDPVAHQFLSYRHQSSDQHSLPSNRIYSVLVDRSDTLWIGTRDVGVGRADLAGEGFGRFVPQAEGLDTSQGTLVDSISRAGADTGHIWLGGSDGLRLFDTTSGRVVKSYRREPGRNGALSSNYAMAVVQQPGGPLWVGTADGLNRRDSPDGQFHEIHFLPKEANSIRKIVPSHDGTLWLGTDGGVVRYDPASGAATVVPYDSTHSIVGRSASVNVMLEDRHGRLWVGNPYGSGIDVRDPVSGKFTNYRHDDRIADSLPNDFPRSLYEDRNGGIWIGTLKGLVQVIEGADRKLRFREVGDNGLSSVYIESIEGDDHGMLWVAGVTGRGEAAMISVDPASGRTKFYFASDGINGSDFFDGASVRGSDGTLYFGSMQGFTAVRAEDVRINTIAPEVSVVDLTVSNRSLNKLPRPQNVKLEGPVNDPKRLTLPWNEPTFSVEFAAMHFADPERNRYKYRLDGFDTAWVDADAAHRVATYTNLAPGNYLLHVKAANKNGIWGEPGRTLAIVVPPPFWATWWFRALAVALAVGALALAYRWRIAHLSRRQMQLERLVQQRTGELARKNDALSDAYGALENLSVTDPLTGLHNRRFLEQKMPGDLHLTLRRHEAAGKGGPKNALMIFFLIDLDHFKLVNDHHGHAAGDQVLVEVRRRLQQVFRDSDYLVRWGGEEFLAVARDANEGDASVLADRVRAVIGESDIVLEEGTSIRQTCSIGYASFPFSPKQPRLLSWQQVVKLADLGLYAAKHSGRAAWVGLTCGARDISPGLVAPMLQAPDAAIAAGTLKLSASVAEEVLIRTWKSLAEQG